MDFVVMGWSRGRRDGCERIGANLSIEKKWGEEQQPIGLTHTKKNNMDKRQECKFTYLPLLRAALDTPCPSEACTSLSYDD